MPNAGFGRRGLAVLLDWLIFTLFATTVAVLLQYLFWWNNDGGLTEAEYRQAGYWIQAAMMLFTLFCWVYLQGTPGKLLMGCRIVDAKTGMAPSVGKAIVRYIGYFISALPLGLGFLWILWDPRRQGFHDKLGGTEVLLDDESQKSLKILARELG